MTSSKYEPRARVPGGLVLGFSNVINKAIITMATMSPHPSHVVFAAFSGNHMQVIKKKHFLSCCFSLVRKSFSNF